MSYFWPLRPGREQPLERPIVERMLDAKRVLVLELAV